MKVLTKIEVSQFSEKNIVVEFDVVSSFITFSEVVTNVSVEDSVVVVVLPWNDALNLS